MGPLAVGFEAFDGSCHGCESSLGGFERKVAFRDRAVREKLGVCSFDVLVRRHRLLYASRVARKAPSLLHALFKMWVER